MPGGGACKPETWKAGRGSSLKPASAAGGPGKKEVCPGAEGRWSVPLRGRRGAPGRPGAALGRKGKAGRSVAQPSPVLPGCALHVRRGSRLSALPAAFRLWRLSFPCPSRPPPLPPGATAVPGLRKALGCSAGWIEIQLLTFDPVRPALRLARGKQCLASPRDLPKPGDGVLRCDPGLPAALVKG